MQSKGSGCAIWIIVGAVLLCILLAASGGGSNSSSSSYRSTYSKEDAYDAKYGKGSYKADKALYDSMKDAYNSATGN